MASAQARAPTRRTLVVSECPTVRFPMDMADTTTFPVMRDRRTRRCRRDRRCGGSYNHRGGVAPRHLLDLRSPHALPPPRVAGPGLPEGPDRVQVARLRQFVFDRPEPVHYRPAHQHQDRRDPQQYEVHHPHPLSSASPLLARDQSPSGPGARWRYPLFRGSSGAGRTAPARSPPSCVTQTDVCLWGGRAVNRRCRSAECAPRGHRYDSSTNRIL